MSSKSSEQQRDIAQRRSVVAGLYLRGHYQADIAEQVGVSIPTIERDLRYLRDEWQRSALRDFDAIKAEQLAKLDRMENELWDQWLDSCGAEFKGVKQTGDPRYMTVILNVIDRRCKLFGLDAPQKIAQTKTDGTDLEEVRQMSDEELDARIAELTQKLKDNDG